jgi:hypothetical protein
MEMSNYFTHVLSKVKNISILIIPVSKMARRAVTGHSATTKIITQTVSHSITQTTLNWECFPQVLLNARTVNAASSL